MLPGREIEAVKRHAEALAGWAILLVGGALGLRPFARYLNGRLTGRYDRHTG